jgi:hypothetical protein
MCCTTQSQFLWSAAITAILAESHIDVWSSNIVSDEIWWPVVGHISLLHQKDMDA